MVSPQLNNRKRGLFIQGWHCQVMSVLQRSQSCQSFQGEMAMNQYLLIPFLEGWTSIYQLFLCSPGVQGFDPLPNGSRMLKNLVSHWSWKEKSHPTSNDFMPKLIGIWPTSWGLGAQRWWTSRESWFYVFESRSWNGWTWKIQQILTHMATRQVAPWPRVLREGNGRWCSRWKLNAHRSLQLWLIRLPEWIIFCSKKQTWAVSKGQHEVDTLIHDTFILAISEHDQCLWIERSWFRTVSSPIKSERWGENTLPLRHWGLVWTFGISQDLIGMAIDLQHLMVSSHEKSH